MYKLFYNKRGDIMSMEKLTIKEVKLKGITLPNKKKIIVDKYNEYVLLSTKN